MFLRLLGLHDEIQGQVHEVPKDRVDLAAAVADPN